MSQHSDAIRRALSRLLTPLARILVREGIAYDAFDELARQAYVRAAEQELRLPGRRQTTARVATLTGLTRKEVARLRGRRPEAGPDALDAGLNRAARVVSGWVRDAEFHDADGRPAQLPVEGPGGFDRLVRRYSGDMPPRTVLEELARSGAVERSADGRLRLVRRSYVPGGDTARKLQILGTDTRDLIATIDHNLVQPPEQARFQRKTVYDNVPREFAGAFRERVAQRGQALIEDFDRWLADRDRDRTPGVGGSGRVRLGLAVYMIEDDGVEEATRDDAATGGEEQGS